jgi:RimJ/RimL family protein N-acetyltransferase
MTRNEGDVPPILTPRLRLEWMSDRVLEALLAGRRIDAESLLDAGLPELWPDDEAKGLMSLRLEQMRLGPASGPWLLRAIVERESEAVAGYANFHGPPEEGKAELGYTVFDGYQRRGYAYETAVAMMNWAHGVHGVDSFVLAISPGNQPSLGLAAKLGFLRTGTHMDPVDGEEWVFERKWPDAEPSQS